MANIEEEGLQRPVAQSKYIWAYECCTKTRKNLNFSFNPTHTHTHLRFLHLHDQQGYTLIPNSG